LSKYSVYNQPINGSQKESVLEKMVTSYESSARSIPASKVMDTEEKTFHTDTVMEEKNSSSDNDDNESVMSTNSQSENESRDSSPTHRGWSNRGRGRGRGGRGGHVSPRQTAMEKPKPKPKAKPDYSTFPRCGCGHVYKQVASWQSHWNPKKAKPCPKQEVRCHCGFYTLTSMNYKGLVSQFNAHLNSSICKKP
jgi:hypothetical protein